MAKVIIGKSEIIIPGSWDEMTTEALEALAQYTSHQLPVQTLKVYFLIYLCGMRPGRKVPKDDKDNRNGLEDEYLYYRGIHGYRLTATQLVRLSHALSWMFSMNPDDNSVVLDVKRIRDCYPRLYGNGLKRTLHGPGDGLERLTYEQFIWAQAYEQRLLRDPLSLTSLLACLWHSGKTFDPERIEEDAAAIKSLSADRQTVMFWQWTGSLRYLARRFPRAFAPGEDGGRDVNVFEEQQRIIDALADGDVTRKPLIRQGLLYDVLMTMEQNIKRAEEQKRKK